MSLGVILSTSRTEGIKLGDSDGDDSTVSSMLGALLDTSTTFVVGALEGTSLEDFVVGALLLPPFSVLLLVG